MEESHGSRFSIHPCVTKMYHFLQEAKSPNFQQVKTEHQRPRELTQEIDIPTLKSEGMNMNLFVGLPCTRRQNDSMLLIVNRLTKLAHFIHVKATYSAEDNC